MLIPNDIKQSIADHYGVQPMKRNKHTSGIHTIVIDNKTMKNYVHNCTCVSCSIFDWSMEVYENRVMERYLEMNRKISESFQSDSYALNKVIEIILK